MSETPGFYCAPDRIRTCDLWYRKPTLYPLSYGGITGKTPRSFDTNSTDNGVFTARRNYLSTPP